MLRLRLLLALLAALLLTSVAAPSQAAKGSYTTDFQRWRAADNAFADWTLAHATLVGGAPSLNLATAPAEGDPFPAGSYNGGNFYNGGSYLVGSATSPEVIPDSAFTEAIPSWNVTTPPGTWVETLLRARVGGRWTKWYNLGVWAADTGSVRRHSVRLQGDADATVAVDTLVISAKKSTADAYQAQVRLFGSSTAVPSLRAFSVATSSTPQAPARLAAGDPLRWNKEIDVPMCSQMVYSDGGEVWCSPTSTSMVLAYWLGDARPCEPRVREAVADSFDWIYDGHGNWPFNTAYAASKGLEGYVKRLGSLAETEAWMAAGVPVIVSYSWGKGDLAGAPIARSAGHLAVLVGFDAAGNPIINDPAAASDGAVRRTYDRAEFETLWLAGSGGTVYLIYPAGWATPSL